ATVSEGVTYERLRIAQGPCVRVCGFLAGRTWGIRRIRTETIANVCTWAFGRCSSRDLCPGAHRHPHASVHVHGGALKVRYDRAVGRGRLTLAGREFCDELDRQKLRRTPCRNRPSHR